MSREKKKKKKKTQKQRGCIGLYVGASNRDRIESTKGGEVKEVKWRRSVAEREIRGRGAFRGISISKNSSPRVCVSPCVYSNQKNIYSKKLRARIQRDPRLNCSWNACSRLRTGTGLDFALFYHITSSNIVIELIVHLKD